MTRGRGRGSFYCGALAAMAVCAAAKGRLAMDALSRVAEGSRLREPGRADFVSDSGTGEDAMYYVWMVIVGFVVGLIARAILPGTQKLGIILTAVLGIAGALVAGLVGQALGWYGPGQGAGFIASIIGAVVLLFVYTRIKPGSTPGK